MDIVIPKDPAATVPEPPLRRTDLVNGVSAWIVTGYETSRRLLNDPRLIKVGPRLAPFGKRLHPDVVSGIHRHMLYTNGEEHARLRRLVMKAFSRRRSDSFGSRIQELTDELLDAMTGAESADLVAALAFPLPVAVICELLGVPADRRSDFQRWSVAFMAPEVAGFDAYAEAASEFLDFARTLIAEKRRVPGEDLLSDLLAARDGGGALDEDELTSMMFILVLAGHETTANLIGNGVLTLISRPPRERASGDITSLVEELLRLDGPANHTLPYQAAEPIVTDGVTIEAGELVFVGLRAANRDPRRFSEPGRFDPEREDAAHIAFGHGIHYCVGAPLARLETRIALRSVMDRFPDMTLAVSPESLVRKKSMTIYGLEALPVRLRTFPTET